MTLSQNSVKGDGDDIDLGQFTLTQQLGDNTSNAQVFDFGGSFLAQYAFFDVLSNFGSNRVSLGEVVFEVEAPEPMTILGTTVAIALGVVFKRRLCQ